MCYILDLFIYYSIVAPWRFLDGLTGSTYVIIISNGWPKNFTTSHLWAFLGQNARLTGTTNGTRLAEKVIKGAFKWLAQICGSVVRDSAASQPFNEGTVKTNNAASAHTIGFQFLTAVAFSRILIRHRFPLSSICSHQSSVTSLLSSVFSLLSSVFCFLSSRRTTGEPSPVQIKWEVAGSWGSYYRRLLTYCRLYVSHSHWGEKKKETFGGSHKIAHIIAAFSLSFELLNAETINFYFLPGSF